MGAIYVTFGTRYRDEPHPDLKEGLYSPDQVLKIESAFLPTSMIEDVFRKNVTTCFSTIYRDLQPNLEYFPLGIKTVRVRTKADILEVLLR